MSELIAEGAARPPLRPLRPFFCRTCQTEREARYVPEGWYSVSRHMGGLETPMVRLGLYCSAACLARQMPRLAEQESILSP